MTKHGQPMFLAVPVDKQMLRGGLAVDLALKLYRDNVVSLGKAARLAGVDIEAFMEALGQLGIPVIDYDASELAEELDTLS